MTRKGHSRSHESPSYKVHNLLYTSRYRYTYIMHNATTQSKKVKQTLPTFQGYGLARYRKCKTDIAMPRERGPGKEQEKIKWYKERGNPNTCSREKAKGGKQQDITTQGGQAFNLLNIALLGLVSSYLHLCPFGLCLGGCALTPSILAPCVYMLQTREQANSQAKKEIKEIGRACKEQTNKESQTGANKAC